MKNILLTALAWTIGLAASAATESVTATTSAAVGTQLTFLVNNSHTGVTMDWGDGTPVPYTQATDGIIEVTGKVAGATLKLSSERPITMLSAEGCQLTAITLSGAPSLRSLYLQHNALTTVEVSKLSNLRDLNVAHNALTRLTLSTTSVPLLETLNLSDNEISTTSFSYGTDNLQYLALADNNYKTVSLTKAPNLTSLLAGGNQITALNLKSNTNIAVVSASYNNIATVTFPEEGLTTLQQFLVAGNELTGTLTLSQNKKLHTLDVADNALTYVALPTSRFQAYDCSGNALLFNSFPRTTYIPTVYAKFVPQEPYDMAALTGMTEGSWGSDYLPWATMAPTWNDRSSASYVVDMSALRSGSASTSAKVDFVVVNEDGSETMLRQTTSSTGDLQYANTSGKVAFFLPAKQMYGVFTDEGYPDITLRTAPFAVLDPTSEGIATLQTDMQTEGTSPVYTLDGRALRAPQRGVGGLYIINNNKVLIK